jgi:hypothetical protein
VVGPAERLVYEVMIWARRASGRKPSEVIQRPAPRLIEAGVEIQDARASDIADWPAAALAEQLVEEGLAVPGEHGHLIPWDSFHAMLDDPERVEDLAILQLPAVTGAKPMLVSRGSLTDQSFSVSIGGWENVSGKPLKDARSVGASLEWAGGHQPLSAEVWCLLELVAAFGRRDPSERNDASQRRAWGQIRHAALAAGARLDDFLFRTVVLTPDSLQLSLRRADPLGLVEVQPWFEGAPTHWLDAFDKAGQVRDRYDLTTPEGVVLRELKRMPGRRVTGERAEAFLVNPIAALGPDAASVIDAEQFAEAREQAGIAFDRFAAVTPETHGQGALGLLITLGTADRIETREISLDTQDVVEFVDRVEAHLGRGLQLCSWDDYEFELDGDSALHCAALRRALEHGARSLISYGDVYDLSGYSERVEAIGQEKSFYSPYIAKRNGEEGWFPENIVPLVAWTDTEIDEPVSVPLSDEALENLRADVEAAGLSGAKTVDVPGCPQPMPVREAAALLSTFAKVTSEAKKGKFDPARAGPRGKRPTLILKSNIEQIDYREERLAALAAPRAAPRLPERLRPGVVLKEHQLSGLGFMQHLLSLAPDRCRGVLLADDMGLGKTLQILCLIARAREEDPSMPPALVVAPLSLLENWREEADKFLLPGAVRLLTAYGDGLAHLRVDKASVDEQLRREGLVRFLTPDWRGDADVVLTTYETLRDLEFTFSRERWSIMVCDEAQKIKNPNAAMTRVAKKQKAAFRIACTGTPVENSLVDIWCLFDFVQPGLLKSLNEFGSTYRRPIEAVGEEDRVKLDELRALIEPQVLRRMKADVATDLSEKIVDEVCRRLPMSNIQRGLYVEAVDGLRRQTGKAGSAAHLGLLHRLRLICSEPGRPDGESFDAMDRYRAMSPKLDWLVDTLGAISRQGEKVIIFCEFKAVQRLIRHYVREAFGVDVDIINGDTSAAAYRADSRQKRIRAFQERPGFGVIVLSPVAVGFGVNMQAANHVIHFTRTWNPAKEDQATDRAYRIGQTKDVYVYYPTVSAPDFKTFDVKLDELLDRKRSLAGDMLNGTGDIGLSDFDIDELAVPSV